MMFNRKVITLISFLMIFICYFFIDRQLTLWMYTHQFYQIRIFYYFTYLPNIFAYGSIILILPFFIASTIQTLKQWQKVFLVASVNMYMAVVVSHALKLILGRSDPKQFIATMFSNKLSTYGFHLFHVGFGDMPSGHTAAIFAASTIIWNVHPNFRWLCIVVCTAVIAGLVAMNDHFLGGCIAGALVGAFIGRCSKNFYFQGRERIEEGEAPLLEII